MEIAIVDNQNNFIEIIKRVLDQLQYYDLNVYYYSCISEMEESYISFHLIFLNDTQAQHIYEKKDFNKNIIFFTDEQDKENDLFDSNIYPYIRKDYTMTKCIDIVEHALKTTLNNNIIIFKINYSLKPFNTNEIVYFQYIGGRTIGFVYKQHHYLIKSFTLKDLKQKLNHSFVYVDRNTLVNIFKIVNICGNEMYLRGIKQSFKISKRRVTIVKETYKNVCQSK